MQLCYSFVSTTCSVNALPEISEVQAQALEAPGTAAGLILMRSPKAGFNSENMAEIGVSRKPV